MYTKNKTAFFFLLNIVLSIIATLITLIVGMFAVPLLAGSVGLNAWSLHRNSTGGFIRSREMHRATEPAREWNKFQVFFIFTLFLLELAVYFKALAAY